MRSDVDPVDPRDFSRYKIFFLYQETEGERWQRDATPVSEDGMDFESTYAQFWLDITNADNQYLYVGCLQGDPDDESAGVYTYGDEFGFEPWQYDEALETRKADPTAESWFTVLGAWDTGDGWCRNVSHVWAKGWVHAELIWRAEREGTGDVLVAAVVAGRKQGIENPDRLFCTESGKAPGSSEETELAAIDDALHPRKRGLRRIFGH